MRNNRTVTRPSPGLQTAIRTALGTLAGFAFFVASAAALPPTRNAPSAASAPAQSPASAPAEAPASAPAEAPSDAHDAAPGGDASTASTATAPRAANAKQSASAASSSNAAASAAASAVSTAGLPQFQAFVPSFARLADAARRSAVGQVADALSGLVAAPANESGEEFDAAALRELLSQAADWPDTSIVVSVHQQDAEGRPRWCIRVDWPLAELRNRVERALAIESAKKVIGEFEIREEKDGGCAIALPEIVLCHLVRAGRGSMITSALDLRPRATAFERQARGEAKSARAKASAPASAPTSAASSASVEPLLRCVYDLTAGREQAGGLGDVLTAVSRIEYSGGLDGDAQWRESWNVRWNLLVGGVAKAALAKVRKPFALSRDVFAAAAFHLDMEGVVDGLADLPTGTLTGRTHGELGVVIAPGVGFLPIPDVFFVARLKSADKALEDIRKAIDDDTQKRVAEDERIAWREEEINGRTIFWRDPAADRSGGLSLWTSRTVLIFEKSGDTEKPEHRLIIASTSTSAESAVQRWIDLNNRSDSMSLPSTRRANWQGVIHWAAIYQFVQPWLALAVATGEGGALPPPPEELARSLRDSTIDLRVEYAGLKIDHCGPLALGLLYVPAIAGIAFESGIDEDSQAARERLACRHLRVLHHHAKLFKKDYGRWPANIDELDGYVDFESQPYLLRLQRSDDALMAGLSSMLTLGARAKPRGAAAEESDEGPDTSLYVVRWSENEAEWRIAIRDGEFKELETITVDAAGELHRVPKAAKAGGA